MSDETLREVAELLFGEGAEDLIAKATTPSDQADLKQRKITAALSATGGAAGAAGLVYSGKKFNEGMKAARLAGKPAFRTAVRSERGAAALFPLEVAGLGGEVMATKILHNDTKKKISKADPDGADLHVQGSISVAKPKKKKGFLTPQQVKGKLIRHAAKKAEPKAKALTVQAAKEVTYTDERHLQKSAPTITWEGEISKVNEEKRQVFGWASVVEKDGKPITDLQGDYIDINEIEKSAYDYVVKSRKGGNQHQRAGEQPLHVSDMIESLIVTPEKKAVLGLPESTPLGWWVGFQINDDDTWNDYKTGKRTQFSIHGRGKREVVA